jgi:hypothetical protein
MEFVMRKIIPEIISVFLHGGTNNRFLGYFVTVSFTDIINYMSLKGFNDGVLHSVLLFSWNKFAV